MSDHEELAKDLGLLSALTIGIGTMIGAGIFVLPGIAAREAGPIVVLSFVVGGVIALVNAVCISELATAMPRAGGGYIYINRALGPLFGSIAGMGDWMGLAFASAFYCIGFGGYLVGLLDGTVLALPVLDLVVVTVSDVQLGAIFAGVVFVGVNYIGAKETGRVQTVIVLTLLLILTIFAASGLLHFDWSTVTRDGVAPTDAGYGAILPGTALVFVSFLGYAKIATVAEEMKRPGRDLPIALIGSVVVVTLIYTVLVGLMVGVVPWDTLDREVPVSEVAGITFDGLPLLDVVGVGAISLAALLATASSANASILSSARINFAMGRDEVVSDWLNEIHPRFVTPYRSIALTGGLILAFILVLGGSLEVLSKAASILHLIVYALMNVSLIVFRRADPEGYDPAFRVPLYPLTPMVGATLSLGLIAFVEGIVIALSLAFVLGAILWYFVYARHRTDVRGHLGTLILQRVEPSHEPPMATDDVSDAAPYRVLVPLANPRTEGDLLDLASSIADQRDGFVDVVHIVQVPDQTPLDRGAEAVDRIDAESKRLLETAEDRLRDRGVEYETTTILSHRSFEEIFDAARRHGADVVVMGWGPGRPWTAGRAERPLDELTRSLPCDFLVLKDRGLDADRILLPTAGGPDSDLGAEVAADLHRDLGAEVRLLHVVDDASAHEAGAAFLDEWATDHDLDHAERVIDTSGDIEGAIEREAAACSLLIMGATERGLLSRLVSGSLIFDVVEDVQCSVLLAERPTERSLLRRLFGRR
ncbi:MAG: amino acid permease [Halobacteriales archaeon]